ncbi:MAG: YncE family protein [Alphaproteobacteria bacterium]|nr:YncE family protein [Alphaproteobacteria bacterium]
MTIMPRLKRRFVAGLAVCVVMVGAAVFALLQPKTAMQGTLVELARIPVGAEPLGIDIARDGSVIVAAAAGRTLHVLDPYTFSEVSSLDLSSYGRLSRVFVDQASGDVFVTASIKGHVLKMDSNASSVLATANTGGFPQGMALADGKLLIALTGGQAVAVLDPADMAPLERLDAGDRPSSIHVDRNGEAFYVVKSTTRSVWVFDLASLKWTHTISDPSLVRLSDIAQAPHGRLLLLDATQDSLLVLDASGSTIEARIPLLPAECGECTHVPMALTVSPDGKRVVVVGRGGWVSLVDLKTQELVGARQAGHDLRGVVWAGDGKIFTTSFASGEVVVLGSADG